MKRSIAILLLLAMILGVFAGCKQTVVEPTEGSTAAPTEETIPADAKENLAAAAEYLKTYYKDALTLTSKDYNRLGAVRIGLEQYPITWSVDVSEDVIKIVTNDDGSVTIDIADGIKEDTPYVLTATLTDAYGNVETVTFEYTIPASLGDMSEIVDMAYALQPGEALETEATLTGEVISVNTPYNAGYKNVTVTIKVAGREDYPIMCYRMKGEGADTVTVGDTITVTGILKNYNGTIEFDAGCTLDELVKGDFVFDLPEDPKEIVDMAYALGTSESIPVTVTLTGKVTSFKETYTDQYKNISVWMTIEGREDKPILAYRLISGGAEVSEVAVGDTITVTGIIVNYNGTIEFNAKCTLDARESGGGKPPEPETSHYYAAIVTPGESYYLYMNVSGTNYYFTGKMAGNYLATSTNSGDAALVTVEGIGDYGRRFYIMDNGVKKYIEIYEYIRESDGKLKSGVRLVETPTNLFYRSKDAHAYVVWGSGGDAYFMGTYGSYTTISSSSFYYITGSNAVNAGVTQYVADFMKPEDAPAPQEPTDPSEAKTLTIPEANELGKSQSAYTVEKYKVTGVITMIDNTKYGNLYIADEDGNAFYIYGLYDADGTNRFDAMDPQPKVGDTITACGVIGQYSGQAQMKNGWVLELIPGEGVEEPEIEELTIAEAYAMGAAMDHNTTTTVKYQVTGVIKNVASTTYGNMTIEDGEGNTLYIYGTYDADGTNRYDAMEVKPVAGDTVTLVGVIGNYNGAQMKNGWVIAHTPAGTTPEEPEEPDVPVEPEIEELTIAEAYAMGAAMDHNTTTTVKYQVTGVIESIASTTWGNLTITDGNGNSLYIYGTYSADGTNRYDAMEVKPVAGDTITLVGVIGNYNGAQMKNGWVIAHTPAGTTPEEPEEPDVPVEPEIVELTIAEAYAKGAAMTHDTTTTEKYQVTGVIESIASTTWGNLTITDGNGNSLYIYGTYSADGSTRYDAMAVKPVVGDTITLVGVIGNYNGAQMKNGWVIAHTPAGTTGDDTANLKTATLASAVTATTVSTDGQDVTAYTTLDSEIFTVLTHKNGNSNNITFYDTYFRIFKNSDLAKSTTLEITSTKKVVSIKVNYLYTTNEDGSVNYSNVGLNAIVDGVTTEGTEDTKVTSEEFAINAYSFVLQGKKNNSKITSIEITYEDSASGSTTEPTPDPDQEAADAVIALIDAIGTVTLDSEEAIVAARAAYDTLTDEQKALVTNLETLTAAEAALEELKKPVAPTDPVEIVKAAYALAEGESLPYTATLTGKIIAVDDAYSTQFSNITVTIEITGAETMPIKCYRLKGTDADTLNVNDIITVTGTLTNYNDVSIQFAAGCNLDAVTQMDPPATPADAVTLSFADKANRTYFSTSKQVWEQNDIVLTNEKASSTSNVADYAAPARFYKSSSLKVEYAGMTKIVFECNSTSYANALKSSITAATGVTVTVSGLNVTVEFDAAVDSYTITSLTGGQVRMNQLTVYTG